MYQSTAISLLSTQTALSWSSSPVNLYVHPAFTLQPSSDWSWVSPEASGVILVFCTRALLIKLWPGQQNEERPQHKASCRWLTFHCSDIQIVGHTQWQHSKSPLTSLWSSGEPARHPLHLHNTIHMLLLQHHASTFLFLLYPYHSRAAWIHLQCSWSWFPSSFSHNISTFLLFIISHQMHFLTQPSPFIEAFDSIRRLACASLCLSSTVRFFEITGGRPINIKDSLYPDMMF